MLHTRIRLDCSDLSEHRYRAGKSDTPRCKCGASREDTEHYLLKCKLYHLERTAMFQSVSASLNKDFSKIPNKVKMKIMLFGYRKGWANDVKLANAVQQYLQLTRRFNRDHTGA